MEVHSLSQDLAAERCSGHVSMHKLPMLGLLLSVSSLEVELLAMHCVGRIMG